MLVSWIFLAFAVWVSLFTANAFYPIKRNRLFYVPSFFGSWLTIELAWVHLVWESVAVAAFAWLGAFDAWPGWLGLGLVVANWVGLAILFHKSHASAGLAAQALAELDDEDHWWIGGQGVHRTKHVAYARAGGKTLRLDVFQPKEPGTRRPAILQVHGGGWVIGDKREQGLPLLKHLTSRGWVGFNANYRLSPGATWPDHLLDLKAALLWIRAHADEYGVDPNFIAVTGGSAGGHLTAMLALTANRPEYQPQDPEGDTSVQAAVPLYGVYDFTNRNETMPPEFVKWFLEPMIMKKFLAEDPEAFAKASPMDCVTADAPPFFVIHGDRDTLAPVEDARTFVAELSENSHNPIYYLELHGAQHAFDVFSSVRTRRVVRSIHRFLGVLHARYLAGLEPSEEAPHEPHMPAEVIEIDEPADVEAAQAS